MHPSFVKQSKTTLPLYVLEEASVEEWLAQQQAETRSWVRANGFSGKIGQSLGVPGSDGTLSFAIAGFGSDTSRARGRFALAAAAVNLPGGSYRIEKGPAGTALETECLGWLLAQYRFDRYKQQPAMKAGLVAPGDIDAAKVERLARGECLTRDLINTPASDMGPEQLEQAARFLAKQNGAEMSVVTGDALLERDFPMIHAVGRAAGQAPRLIDMRWGNKGPTLTLVGKGVCFDTGGLNLKPGVSMGLMKKDMGGAATVLGLAQMIMEQGPRLQLRVLIPAVENSVSATAFRPQDILTSRKGLTVEINNTDAEGRLVLADALALADEDTPDLIVSMATLTGAARVAVGPDLAPFYTDDPAVVSGLEQAARTVSDPVWRMPFHAPYETMIEPGIADLDNAPKGGFAGSITAALFLRRFVTDSPRYVHFDIFGWQPTASPARPKGGAMQGARALLAALPGILDL